mgnify:CR=1 FL=1
MQHTCSIETADISTGWIFWQAKSKIRKKIDSQGIPLQNGVEIFRTLSTTANPIQTVLSTEQEAAAKIEAAKRQAEDIIAKAETEATASVTAAEADAKGKVDERLSKEKATAQAACKQELEEITREVDVMREHAHAHVPKAVDVVVQRFMTLFTKS